MEGMYYVEQSVADHHLLGLSRSLRKARVAVSDPVAKEHVRWANDILNSLVEDLCTTPPVPDAEVMVDPNTGVEARVHAADLAAVKRIVTVVEAYKRGVLDAMETVCEVAVALTKRTFELRAPAKPCEHDWQAWGKDERACRRCGKIEKNED